MLNHLLIAHAAMGRVELDMDRHAALQCRYGVWRQNMAQASDWIALKLKSIATRP